MKVARFLQNVVDDARFGIRQLKAAPAFSITAIVTLALGIGANTAIFALADAAWLRPLPFGQPDRLVMLFEDRADLGHIAVNPREFVDWTERAISFDGLAAFAQSGRPFIGDNGIPEPLPSQSVTVNFFDVLGVAPLLGRTFVADDVASRARVVVLSEGFWRSRLGGDPSIVGKSIHLDGGAFTVIGVVPASMQLLPPTVTATGATAPAALWMLLVPQTETARFAHYVQVVGRLKDGATVEAARGDISRVASGLAREFPDTNRGHGAGLEPLRASLIGPEVRLTSIVLVAVTACVLLLACANVANLLVTRGFGRQRELAVRSALGASRTRIAAQLIVETLLLAGAGGLTGAAVAFAILHVAPALIPAGLLPVSAALTVDARVLAFCAVSALAVALLCGLAPARYASRVSLSPVLAAAGRAIGSGGAFRSALAIAQVASAMLLLCGAALLLRSLVALERRDPGDGADHVLTALVSLPFPFGPATRYPTLDSLRQYYDAVGREVRAVPSVRRVAWGTALPLDGLWFGQPFAVDGDPPKPTANRDIAQYQIVSASYFSTLGIPIVGGRDFTSADGADALPVCIVDEAFARRFLGTRNPVGMRVTVPLIAFAGVASAASPAGVDRLIVGVVRSVRALANEADAVPRMYVPQPQNPWYTATLVVQSSVPPSESLVAGVRAAVARVDRDRPLANVRTLDTIAADATARWRFRAQLVAAFAALALTLAIVGVFGLLAYTVQQRTREFGLRMAIGARGADVARLVVAGIARVTGAGMLLGLIAAAVSSRGITSLLFGVRPLDGISFTSAIGVLAVTAALAAVAPVLRAVRVDPAETLKSDF